MVRRTIRIALLAGAAMLAVPAKARPLTPAEKQQVEASQAALGKAMEAKDWTAASAALRQNLAINRAAYGNDDPQTLSVLETLAISEQFAGRHAEALAILSEAEAGRTRRNQGESAEMAQVQASIGINQDALGKYAEAEAALKRSLAIRLKTNGAGSREVAFTRNALAQALTHGGKYAEARDMFVLVLEANKANAGPDSDDVAVATGNLASVETNLGNYDRAQALYDQGLALHRKRHGAKSIQAAVSLNNIGFLKAQRGDYPGAQAALSESLAIQRELFGNDNAQVATSLGNLASVVQNGGKPADSLALFKEATAIMTRSKGADHPDTLRLEANYATALSDLDRDAEAEPIARRVLDLRRKALSPGHPDVVTALNNLAAVTESLGREQEAEALYREAIAAARAEGGDPSQLATTISGLAVNLGEQGRYEEALKLHEQALDLRRKLYGDTHPDVALSLSNVGFILGQQGDHDASNKALAAAVAIGRKGVMGDLPLATALNNYASSFDELKRFKEAEPIYREALAIRTKRLGPNHLQTASVVNNLGYNMLSQGKKPQAVALFRQSLTAMRKGARPDSPDLIPPLDNLAILLAEKPGGQAEALKLGREAAEIARKRRALIAGGGTGDAAVRAAARARGDEALSADPYVTAFIGLAEVNWKIAARDTAQAGALRDEAFFAAQEVDLSKAAQAMAKTAARTASGGGPLGALIGRQQTLATQLAAYEADYLQATSAGDAAAAGRAEAASRQTATELASLDAKIDSDFPAYRALIAPTPLAVPDIAAKLAKDEGLIFIVPLNGSMYSYAIGPGGTRWHRVEKGQQRLQGDVKALLCQLDPVTCEGAAGPERPLTPSEKEGYRAFDRAKAFGLYNEMIAPVEAALAGAKRVYTVSVGKVGALPLGLLPTSAPQVGSDDADPDLLAQTPWLSDRYALVTLPSVSSLRFTDTPHKGATQAFVGYGAPRLGGGKGSARALRGAGAIYKGNRDIADQTLLSTLAPLPGTEIELKAMAGALGGGRGALRLATAATEGALKKDTALRKARVIAFATHGLLPGELTGYDEPGLVFTPPAKPTPDDDGVLSASEAAALSLDADWVILSACNTAAGDSSAAGLSGLARAFLFAGARSLLASHWRVSDEATAQLTVEALMGDKTMTRGQALQAAMKAVRTGKRADGSAVPGWKADWAHPAIWAPFSLIANSDR